MPKFIHITVVVVVVVIFIKDTATAQIRLELQKLKVKLTVFRLGGVFLTDRCLVMPYCVFAVNTAAIDFTTKPAITGE